MTNSINKKVSIGGATPPIIEAILDIDCDFAPGRILDEAGDELRSALGEAYPIIEGRKQVEQRLEAQPEDKGLMTVVESLGAFRFWKEDRKQLVQVRSAGFSFNRLAPYSSLDDYLPEIRRCWEIYVRLLRPVAVRAVRLRYINRLPIPLTSPSIELDEYLKIGPRVPEGLGLTVGAFMSQTVLLNQASGDIGTVVLASEPAESGTAPMILDISVASPATSALPLSWDVIESVVFRLRRLKNDIFEGSLGEKCFQ